MPSKSPAQAHMMAMVAHDPAAAKRVGVPRKVGKEFNKADQLAKAKALKKAATSHGPAPMQSGDVNPEEC